MRNLRAGRRRPRLALRVACTLLFTAATAAAAQSTTFREPVAPINYAFSAWLGSGIYSVDGRTVQIYRLPFAVRALSHQRSPVGLRFTFPLTFGFYNFKIQDVLEGVLPKNVSTLTFLPGFEVWIPVRRNWTLIPLGEVGAAFDLTRDKSVLLWSVGVRSLAIFAKDDFRVILGNRLQFMAQSADGLAVADNIWRFVTRVDGRHPLDFRIRGEEADLSIYLKNIYYFGGLNILLPRGNEIDIPTEWEFGVTLGTMKRWKILGIGMPRFGLAYRWNNTDISAIRLVIGGDGF